MLTAIRRSVVVGSLLTALVVLLMGNQSLFAQTTTSPTTGTPDSGEMDMDMSSPSAGTPVTGTPESGEMDMAGTPVSGEQTITVAPPAFEETPLPAAGQDQMGQMMDDCIDMMDMMMGGGMPGPMGSGIGGPMSGGGMPGPMGGGMGSPMDQCLGSMGMQASVDRSGLMAFSTEQCLAMLGGGAMPGM